MDDAANRPATPVYALMTFIGRHTVAVERGDAVYYVSDDSTEAFVRRGSCEVRSSHCAAVVRGYTPPHQGRSLHGITVVPYVNGCSRSQIFSPIGREIRRPSTT